MHVCVCSACGVRKRCWNPGSRNYTWLWASIWVLGIELVSFARTAISLTLSHLPSPKDCYLVFLVLLWSSWTLAQKPKSFIILYVCAGTNFFFLKYLWILVSPHMHPEKAEEVLGVLWSLSTHYFECLSWTWLGWKPSNPNCPLFSTPCQTGVTSPALRPSLCECWDQTSRLYNKCPSLLGRPPSS